MTDKEKILFKTLFEEPYHFLLLLRGSKDGFTNEIFHKLCDNKDKIVCIVNDDKNNIFGAYTDINFD